MSLTNFYQTLYQTDQLYRVPGESWRMPMPTTDDTWLPATEPEPVTGDLLADLDRLAQPQTPVSDHLPASPASQPLIAAAPALVPPVSVPVPAPTAVPDHLVERPENTVLPVSLSVPLPVVPARPSVPTTLPPTQPAARVPELHHKVLLLADEELDPSNLLFLEKILKAVNLNIDGVDLLNLNGVRDVDFAEMVTGKHVHHFITFGVPFSRVNLDIAMDRYLPVRFFGINFLMADSLPTIEADVTLKKRLWGALQQIFMPR
ncbi:hypothetical protein GCM10027578_40110 [Spirosoma luteolum]